MAAVTVDSLAELYQLAKDLKRDVYERAAALEDYQAQVDSLPTIYHGPTWRRNEAGKWDLPERTLGWQVIGWISEYINLPKPKDNPHGTGKLTREQVRFLLWWYAVDDNGDFVFRTGVLQRLKGWGKDPVMAMLCLVEFVGPSRFSHWHPLTGEPVAMQTPDAWVQIAAVSREQTKNTVTLFPGYMTKKLVADYGIKPGSELWRAEGGKRRMEIVTSNPATIEGGRSTFVCLNETHHWTSSNRGVEMYDTIEGNVTKMGGRWLAITNAYMPGQGSVAEILREAWEDVQEGRAYDVGMLYDSVEADPRAPMTPEAMRIILPKVRGDAGWLPVEDTIKSALNRARAVSKSRRMYYNQIVASEDAIYSDVEWKAIEDPDLELRPGDKIVLGFDGSKSRDATALVALRVKDQAAFLLGLWERPTGAEGEGWTVDRAKVNSAVLGAVRRYKVVGMYADVREWESYIDDWHEAFGANLVVQASSTGNAIAWDMRQGGAKPTLAHERLVESVLEGKLKHNGDRALRRHVLNARRRENNYGLSFGKESGGSDKKVDAYAALMLAHECLHDFRTRRTTEREHDGQVWFF